MSDATAPRNIDWMLMAIGGALVAGGAYFALAGTGLAPLPSEIHGPVWLALSVGVVFFCAGVAVLVRGWLGLADSETRLPEGTPRVYAVTQWLAGFGIFVGMASIGSWIAFGSGERAFSMSLPFTGSLGEIVGRTMFGFGAIIIWLAVAAMAVRGIRTVWRRPRTSASD